MNTQTAPSDFTPIFKRGDIVHLNSGGPQMTVQEPAADEGDPVKCVWFTSDDTTVLEQYFFEECLTAVAP